MILPGLSALAQGWEVVAVKPHYPDRTLCQWKILVHQIQQQLEEECLELEAVLECPLEIEEVEWAHLENLCLLTHH